MTKESPRDAGRLAFTERMPSAQSRKLRQVIHGTVHIALVVGQRDRGSGFELRRNPPQGHVVLFRAVVDEQLAQLPALVAAEAQCLGDTTERRMGDSATSGLGLELGVRVVDLEVVAEVAEPVDVLGVQQRLGADVRALGDDALARCSPRIGWVRARLGDVP